MKKINIKNLELIRRIIQISTIVYYVLLIPILIWFLIQPGILIPEYNYREYAILYILYTVLFIFTLTLIVGINRVVKRYSKQMLEKQQ